MSASDVTESGLGRSAPRPPPAPAEPATPSGYARASRFREELEGDYDSKLMAVATRGTSSNYLQRAPSPSGLADVIDLILDKGLVIDAYLRVAVIGIELVTIDARIVIASVDTYLRFAEAVNRLDLTETHESGIEALRGSGAKEKTKGAIEGAEEEAGSVYERMKEKVGSKR